MGIFQIVAHLLTSGAERVVDASGKRLSRQNENRPVSITGSLGYGLADITEFCQAIEGMNERLQEGCRVQLSEEGRQDHSCRVSILYKPQEGTFFYEPGKEALFSSGDYDLSAYVRANDPVPVYTIDWWRNDGKCRHVKNCQGGPFHSLPDVEAFFVSHVNRELVPVPDWPQTKQRLGGNPNAAAKGPPHV